MPRIEMTMSAGYQITVPSVLRKTLGLVPGDKIAIDTDKAPITIEKAETQEERVKRAMAKLERLKIEREKTLTPKQKQIMEMTKGWTVNQFHEYFDNLPETKEYLRKKYNVKIA